MILTQLRLHKGCIIQNKITSAISGVNIFRFLNSSVLNIICFQSHSRMGYDSSSNKRETKWPSWRHFRIRWNRQKTSAGHNHKSLPSQACLSASFSAYNWYSNQLREKPHKSYRVKFCTTIKYEKLDRWWYGNRTEGEIVSLIALH